MKTVKFKDLPEKVQRFINRVHGFEYDKNDDIILDSVHTASEWSKATDEERLAYAEWRYKFGVRLKDAYDDEEYDLKLRDTIFYLEKDPRYPHDILLTRHSHDTDITIYDSDKKKWAEIIEEPEKEEKIIFSSNDISDSDKKEIERMIKESKNTPSNPEPTFKAGEYVEGRMKNWQEDVWTGELLIYTGAKTKSGLFICEYADGEVACFIAIKKTDPDKKYKDAAKEMMTKEGIGDIGGYTHVGISPGKFESMLIEALKKGKEL